MMNETLYTPRFRLRLLEAGDAAHAELYRGLYTCDRVMAQIGAPLAPGVADAAFVRVCHHNTFDVPGHRFWAIEERSTGTPFGMTALQRQRHSAEIGIMLLPGWWNRKGAGEAFQALLPHAFRNMGLKEITARGRAGSHSRILDRLLVPLGFAAAPPDPAVPGECRWVVHAP